MQIKDFGVENWINKYEKDCEYNLSGTCVGVMSVKEVLNLDNNISNSLDNLMNIELGYGKVQGSDRLRKNITDLYGTATDKNIVISHGAIGANSLLMLSLLEAGDRVVTVLPIYQQHYSIPEELGCEVVEIFLKEENSWMPDIEELKKAVNNKTKLICLNNPNNPTGALINDNILKEIIEIARKNGTYILCDEVYRGLSHQGNPFSASIFDLYEKGISTGSMSKTFSLPGLRLGWIIAPENIVNDINRQRDYYVICVGAVNDYLACLALENKQKIIENNLRICKTNLKMLDDWIHSQAEISYIKPHAGTTAFLKYNLNMSSKELCLKLQQETGVMFLPGSVMDMDGYLRIGYSGELEQTKKALNIFSKWLNLQ